MIRIVWIGCGHISLVLGFIGIFLPVLPTTPFALLSAWCYSKGSQRFHDWLYAHPYFGPSLLTWQNHGVIRTRAKIVSTIMIACSLSFPLLLMDFHWGLKLVAACGGIGSLSFILTRPSSAKTDVSTNVDRVLLTTD